MIFVRLHQIRMIFNILTNWQDVKIAVYPYISCTAGCFGSQVGELEITCFMLLDFKSIPVWFLIGYRIEYVVPRAI